ncbi:MAG: PqqD family protein [Nitrospirae bacterium]|nr:PqqD family protein [Nitrospirota bacterium]
MDKDRCFVRNSSVSYKLIGDELIIVDPYRHKLLRLNNVGRVIWELLDGRYSIVQITDILGEQFDVTRETIEKDVSRFISLLFKRELIK